MVLASIAGALLASGGVERRFATAAGDPVIAVYLVEGTPPDE
jgi:hypothetical protein